MQRKERHYYADPIELWGKPGDWDISVRDRWAERPEWRELPPRWPKDHEWWPLYQKCESPIEQLLCVCLERQLKPPIIFWSDDCRYEAVRARAEADGLDRLTLVIGQFPIRPYRVDFYVARYVAARDNFMRRIVECDGHEFHTGDPTTWIRERERDRFFESKHLQVMHFSGTEIRRDPAQCAAEIDSALG